MTADQSWQVLSAADFPDCADCQRWLHDHCRGCHGWVPQWADECPRCLLAATAPARTTP